MIQQSTPTATLASVIESAESAPNLTARQRRDLVSAIMTFCRVVGLDPHLVAATAPNLTRLIRDSLPAAIGINAARWRNVTSLVRKGLTLVDDRAMPARLRAKLLPMWSSLMKTIAGTAHSQRLSRLSKWCSLQGIDAESVNDGVLESFLEEMNSHCVIRCAGEAQRSAIIAWNAMAGTISGWPQIQLRVPNRRKNPSLPMDTYPPTLDLEIEAFLADCSREEDSLDSDDRLLRPVTIINKRAELRQAASAMVRHGVCAESLGSLADLVKVENVKAAIEHIRARDGKMQSGHLFNIARLLHAIARHRVKADAATIAKLGAYCKKVRPPNTGMTPKNEARLHQFDDERQMSLFLSLPSKLMNAATSIKSPTITEALIAQDAVLLMTLQAAPLRISNIAELEIGRTLFLSEKTGQIVLPAAKVKNNVALIWPLPPAVVAMIGIYLKRFHPLLAPAGCKMLFPGRDGRQKNPISLSLQVKKRVRAECGIAFNAHLIRHLVAAMILEEHPAAYGFVKQILGHKSIQTTIDSYCSNERKTVIRLYDTIVQKRRAGGGT